MGSVSRSVILCICSFAGIINYTNAQKMDAGKWQIGINGGVFIYMGDLAPSPLGSYKTPSAVIGVNISRILDPYFALRANVVFGKLRGNDSVYNNPSWRQQRNFNFSTPVTELSAQLVWNLFGNNNNELGLKFSPYLFSGAGVSFLNISRDYSRLNRAAFPAGNKTQLGLAIDSVHTLPGSILVLPVGAGVAYYISPKISLTAETSFRYTFTDYLDGFSRSANPDRKDFYHSHTIGIIFRFGKKNQLDCPVLKY